MNILLLNDDFPPHGKSSVSGIVKDVAQQLKTKGHAVTIITTHRTNISPKIIREGNVISLPISYRTSLRHYFCLYNPKVARLLAQELRKIKPDVVHAHNLHTHLTYHALAVAKRFTPHVSITMHDVMSFSYGRVATKNFLDSEGQDVHTDLFDHIRQAGLQYNPLRNMCIRFMLRRNATRVFAVSNALKRALDAHHIINTEVRYNRIDTHFWRNDEEGAVRFRKEHRLEDRKLILFGGRLSRDKGSTPLLHALNSIRKNIPNVFLIVIGNPVSWEGLVREAQIVEDLSQYITCLNWLSKEELRSVYSSADIVTTPSLCLDTFNLMNAEAMSCETPVVGTCFGGTPEVVENDVTGFIRNPLHIEEYTDALQKLLTDDVLAKNMGKAGRKRMEELFDIHSTNLMQ
ncbi:hypothetical protein A3D11_03695 [Candidatus Peribacteria bacterium RIFCSPHIGHO2_02_FULL_49_16]|nr:MAG: hypothetical protein A2880_04655 [Candidatus Peribacteria bacterium RIFCSPHIGHO2_01_FULL_49_38]OGJ58837.1 MAG: hypothetical protein A3D11_03695 [Candidatus Peribacteria bacterium RIFCSPHIGHO2_02_FULL_49_16]